MASCNGELTTIECASWNYVYAECSINETRTIISATVSTKHSSSACDFYDGTLPEDYDGPGKYGFTNNVLWVHKGCRAEFEICSVGK